MLLVSAGFGLAFHARAQTNAGKKPPARGWVGVLGFCVFVGLWFARAAMGLGGLQGAFAPIAAALSIAAIVLGARALANDPHGHRYDELMETTALGLASIALASLSSIVLAASQSFKSFGGESVDPSQKQRIMDEVPKLVTDELTLALLSATALALIAIILLLPRKAALHFATLQRFGFVGACVAVPCAAVWAQISSVQRRWPEMRPGEPGEFVVDGNIPAGTLLVDLELDDAGSSDRPATVRLADGTTRPWTWDEPAAFDGIALGRAVSFSVLGPYRTQSSGSIVMPSEKGVRVRVPAIRVAAAVEGDDERMAEKVLHIDVTDPLRYRLLWATAQVVQSVRELPRDDRSLAAAVREGWLQEGSHRSDQDRKFDTAIIHHSESTAFDELRTVASAVAETTRAFRNTTVPAFNVFVAVVHPAPRSIDREVDPSRWAAMGDSPYASRAERARSAIEKCQGEPCAVPATRDTYGLELGRWCDRPRCSTPILASLWNELGVALAEQGQLAESRVAFRRAWLLWPPTTLPPDAASEAHLAWRAARVHPSPVVRRGAMSINGRVDPKQVAAVLGSREGWIRACYDDGLARNPLLQGRVSFRFVIGRDGVASNAANAGSDLPDSQVVSCVVRAAAGLVFTPPEGGVATVVAPYALRR